MSIIQVKDKYFKLSIPETEILKAIQRIAVQMREDLRDKNPLFVCVLNGSFMFASDLIKQMEFPCEVTFIRLKSYNRDNTDGKVKEVQGLIEEIKDRNVVILEDIIDTGHTISHLSREMWSRQPQSLKIATLFFKPEALQLDIKPDYVAMEISNDFIVGYGLDYDGHGRNLKDIYKIVEE